MPYVLVLYLDIETHLGKVHYDFSTYVVFRSPFSPNFGMRKCLCIVTKHGIMQRQDTKQISRPKFKGNTYMNPK